MSELIPSISITEFKKLKVHELKRLKSCEVTSDGQYLFTFINPNTEYIKFQAESMAQLSNSVGGETLEQIKGVAPVEQVPAQEKAPVNEDPPEEAPVEEAVATV